MEKKGDINYINKLIIYMWQVWQIQEFWDK